MCEAAEVNPALLRRNFAARLEQEIVERINIFLKILHGCLRFLEQAGGGTRSVAASLFDGLQRGSVKYHQNQRPNMQNMMFFFPCAPMGSQQKNLKNMICQKTIKKNI